MELSGGDLLLRRAASPLLPRDFVETCEGLLFAVVAHGVEAGRAHCFLRYVRQVEQLRKVETEEANRLLYDEFGDYLFHSPARDIQLHGVPLERIVHHYRPADRWAEIVAAGGGDAIEAKVTQLSEVVLCQGLPERSVGVTGSVLVRAHQASSDIDLVVYGRESFFLVRQRLQQALLAGAIDSLSDGMWHEAYRRRGCALTFEEYVWHERRKFNKFALSGTKVDIACVSHPSPWTVQRGRKLERRIIRSTVSDDTEAYLYPARFGITDPDVPHIISFNPTFTGQAEMGETVEASGWLEEIEGGSKRLVIGTSREASGEYLKVVGRTA